MRKREDGRICGQKGSRVRPYRTLDFTLSEMRSHYRNMSNGMNDVSRCVLNDHLADMWHIGHRKARVWETFGSILQKRSVLMWCKWWRWWEAVSFYICLKVQSTGLPTCSERKRNQGTGQAIWPEQPRGPKWCFLRQEDGKRQRFGKCITHDRRGYAVVTNRPPRYTGLTHKNLFLTHNIHLLPVGEELYSEYSLRDPGRLRLHLSPLLPSPQQWEGRKWRPFNSHFLRQEPLPSSA